MSEVVAYKNILELFQRVVSLVFRVPNIFVLGLFVSTSIAVSGLNASSGTGSWNLLSQEIAALSESETVHLDNNFIHTYKNKQGIWRHVDSGTKLKHFEKKYGSEKETIRKLNELDDDTVYFYKSGWYFIPYSEEYLSRLNSKGIRRQALTLKEADLVWPVLGSRITSRIGTRWGNQHTGIDIAATSGSLVLAAQSGKVVRVGRRGAYGIIVKVQHDTGYQSYYAHLSQALVSKGDYVNKGQVVALSGNTGRSTGPHLHFELRALGMVLDPEAFLPRFKESRKSALQFEAKLEDRAKKAADIN